VREPKEKLLVFGHHSPDFLRERRITDDHRIVRQKLGIIIEEESLDTLQRLHHSINAPDSDSHGEVEDLIKKLIEGAQESLHKQPSWEELKSAVSLYLAVSQLVNEHEANAATIVCRDFIHSETLPVPCLALTLLQDRGIPAACQGDLDALLTMILFQRVSRKPSCMGNPYEENGMLVISHCVMSRNMLGFDMDPQPYYLADYHGRKASVTVHTDVPKGEIITYGRFTRNLQSLILGVGEVVDSFDREGICRNGLKITVADMERLMEVKLDHQYHFAVVVGDHKPNMIDYAHEAGIEIIDV
jgi:L-fucose isomerase-like protein